VGLRQRSKDVWRGSVPSDAGALVLDLCEELIDGYAQRRGPMPVVVLHAAGQDPEGRHDDGVRELVDLLHRAQKPRWLLCRSVDPPADRGHPPEPSDTPPEGGLRLDDQTYAATTALVKDVSEGVWENHNRSQYRPYRMPRSRLMAALDQVLDEMPESDRAPDPRAAVTRLTRRRWQPAARPEPDGFWRQLGTMLSPATVLGAAVVAALGVLAAKVDAWPLAAAVLAVLSVPAVGCLIRRRLPPLWLGSGCRWFATTTFPLMPGTTAPVWSLWHPRQSRATLEDRAVDVIRQMLTAVGPGDTGDGGDTGCGTSARESARQFCLQLRTLALLEDLRENHRPAWDLRHRKRTVPPLLLIPRATRANGALPFVRAISDVRSRRSEQDPLLVVAGVAHGDLAGLRERTLLPLPSPDAYRREPARLYEAWVARSLRTGQAPSLNAALPWILPVSLTGPLLRTNDANAPFNERSTYRVRRSPWLLWSRWTLAATCVFATTGAGVYYESLKDRYCIAPETVWNRDLVRTVDDQCVGVVTGRPLLEGSDPPLLDAGLGRRVGLKELQAAIKAENEALDEDRKHITLVFAGALTTKEHEPGDAVDVLRQLAGVYVAQHLVNNPEETNSDLQLRILIANGGPGMADQKTMATKIVEYARWDPSVVGVVGMGIHTPDSADAVRQLQQAGLAVIGTTNSATGLASTYRNYFGMAPTDQEEASLLVNSLGTAGKRTAVVLAPAEGEGPGSSSYGNDQAKYGTLALRAADFTLRRRVDYEVTGTSADMHEAAQRICGEQIDIVYLAGRASHVSNLMRVLRDHTGCEKHPVTVLAGDDMEKKSFEDEDITFPGGGRLRYTSLTYDKHLRTTDLHRRAAAAFAYPLFEGRRLNDTRDAIDDGGFLALSHDAAMAFHTAAAEAGVPGNGRAPAVLAVLHTIEFTGKVGNISFRNADASNPELRGHGIGLHEVTRTPGDSTLRDVTLCGRAAGDSTALRKLSCPPVAPDQEQSSSSPAGSP
jgi:hypothetical protein